MSADESQVSISSIRATEDVREWLRTAFSSHRLGRLDDAERSYEQVLRRQPGHFDALHMLGVIGIQTQRYDRAIDLLSAALECNPNAVAAHRHLALALGSAGRLQEGAARYGVAVSLQPDFIDGYLHWAGMLNDLRRHAEANAVCIRAHRRAPNHAGVQLALAVTLRFLRRPEEALAACDRALELQPAYAEAWDKRSAALQDLNRLDDALASADRAIALRPDFALAHAHRGMLLLQQGRYADGWPEFDWRIRPGGSVPVPMGSVPNTRWTGREPVEGTRILVWAEQGLGDTVQFCRYVALLAARGTLVVFRVQPSIKVLIARLVPDARVIAEGEDTPPCDWHCPLLSLPLALGTLDNIPPPSRHRPADARRVQRWRRHLGTEGYKVGIAWQGSRLPIDVGRSFPLACYRTLAALPGVRLISLQKGPGSEQLDEPTLSGCVERLPSGFDDGPDAFLDTVAVMQSLDLIITPDTAMAHLAGTLGRPTWVALKWVPEWRWMLGRPDSPWYPSMRLFRQSSGGDWQGVFDAMLVEVEKAYGSS